MASNSNNPIRPVLECEEIRLRLDIATPESLKQAAIDGLAYGAESPSLLQLSVSEDLRIEEAAVIFEQALRDLSIEPLSIEQALGRYVEKVCVDILNERVDAYKGAKDIWRMVRAVEFHGHDYDPFIYAASEYEDRPHEQTFFRDAIINEARNHVGDPHCRDCDSAGPTT